MTDIMRRILNDYHDALVVLIAVLPAVDETKLPDRVRELLPDVREHAPRALADLDAIRKVK